MNDGPRPRAALAALLLAASLASCGGDDDAAPAGGPGSAPGGDARGDVPPRLAAVARTDVPGFSRRGERATAASATPWYEAERPNAQGWRAVAVVTFAPCAPCKPIDLAEWRAHEDGLRGVLPPAHRADPRLAFDLFEVDLGGRKGVALHKRSVVVGAGEGGKTSVVHGLTVWTNDGRDEVSVDVTVRGPADAPPAETTADLDARASRDDLLRAARAVHAAFAPALGGGR